MLRNVLLGALALVLLAAPVLADPLIGPLQPLPPGEWVYQAASLADLSMSLDIANHPGIEEANPLLGHHPSAAHLAEFKLATGALHAAITELMEQRGVPKPFIRVWEITSVGTEGAVITKGLRLGLRFRFR